MVFFGVKWGENKRVGEKIKMCRKENKFRGMALP